nr:AAA family ATPase [Larsenimonas suaedae]
MTLTVYNLASLKGPHRIELDRDVLGDTGLFAITGPTGAGKSTLLDGLCLALFGTTPRLKQATQQSARTPDVADDALALNDPRALLRRGAAEGFAEVDFEGLDGERYRARWSVRRARNKPDGRLQASDQSLMRVTDATVLTRHKREFQNAIHTRLGLGFEQFTRAVLLAQSEFNAFLTADDNQRSELLERLTDTDIYSRIAIEAFNRTRTAQQTLTQLEQSMASAPPASEAERAEIDAHESAAATHWQTLTERKQTLTHQRERWQALMREHTALTDSKARYITACDHDRSLDGSRRRKHQLEAVEPLRRIIDQRASTAKALEQARTRISDAWSERRAAQKALNDTTCAHAKRQRELEHHEQHRASLAPHLEQADQIERQLAYDRERIASLIQAERDNTQTLSALKAERSENEHERAPLHARLNALRARLQTRDIDDPLAHRQTLHARMTELRETRDELAHILEQVKHASAAIGAHAEAEATLNARYSALEAQETEKNAADRHQTFARQQLADCQTRLQRQRALRDDAAIEALRATLSDDAPCPVCGGQDHPYRHAPPERIASAQLQAMEAEEQRQLDEATHAAHEAESAASSALAQVTLARQVHEQARAEHDRASAARDQARTDIAPFLARFEQSTPEALEAWLSDRLDEIEAQAHQTHTELNEILTDEQARAPLERRLGELDTRAAVIDSQIDGLETQRSTQARERAKLERTCDTSQGILNNLLQGQDSVRQWRKALEQTTSTLRTQLDDALAKVHRAEQHVRHDTQACRHQLEQASALATQLDETEHQMARWYQTHADIPTEQVNELLMVDEGELEALTARIEAATHARLRAETELATVKAQFEAHLDDTLAALPEATLSATLHERLERDEAALTALAPELERALAERDDTQARRREDDRRRDIYRTLEKQLETARSEYRRWGRLGSAIGSSDGKKFRRIAQGYNLDRLIEQANAHLTQLARRYRLVRGGSDLGLLVIDQEMADEQRSVHSLSGGESFLISLALALGLSSMASSALTINTLFIDEGFGSLDAQSLNLVMDALDALQSQGRKIGVISHVRDMIERIPHQIEVQPLGGGISDVRVVRR